MKRSIQRAELVAGMVILLGGLLTYGVEEYVLCHKWEDREREGMGGISQK